MIKTGGQIELDVFNLFREEIKSFLFNGEVFLRGTTIPTGNNTITTVNEFAVISFHVGDDADIQIETININVYIPDIDTGKHQLMKDVNRCNEVEAFMLSLVQKSKSEYQFKLAQTINSFAEPETHQHFVNVKLKYKRFALSD